VSVWICLHCQGAQSDIGKNRKGGRKETLPFQYDVGTSNVSPIFSHNSSSAAVAPQWQGTYGCPKPYRTGVIVVLYLSEPDIAKVLTYEKLIPAMEHALAAFSAGKVIQPVRQILTIEEGKRFLGVMPAVTPDGMGAKLVAFYPGNEGTKHHTHSATISLFDPETGEPLAFMDGRLITEMRTAAVSAAVTKYAALPDAKVLALIGSGVQAEAHLQALRRVCSFNEVRIWSRTAENARKFADKHRVKAMELEQAVRGADVIVTATNSRQPIVKGAWLKEGAHLNAVGSPRPSWRELDDDVMRNLVIADSREAVLQESGDVILSRAHIFAEAGEVFAGAKIISREKTTVFKSVGLAVEDISTARLVYDMLS
jgi:ornithine cyclodeaminase/alanine dehydrogenase-like protein (mu-crystallin family)